MANTIINMKMLLTPEAETFIEEWKNPLPYIIAHTSGSTGKPKELRLLKSDMRASAKATIRFFGLGKNSLLALPLSPDYIAGKMQIVRALEAGCGLWVERPSNHPLSSIPDSIGRISILPVVPSQLEGLLSSKHIDSIDAVIIGGAPLSMAEEEKMLKTGIKAYATYGMTETCSHVALRALGDDMFTALPGFEFSVDERNCLIISTTTMSFGHLVTNDIVHLLNNRNFIWLGRHDNVINSGGIKIFPEEIEKQIAHLIPQNTVYYVTSRKSLQWGEEAVIVCGNPSLHEDTLDRIREHIGAIRSPKEIIYDPEIRFTDSKKIIRKKFL